MAGIVIDFGVVVACWNYCVNREFGSSFSHSVHRFLLGGIGGMEIHAGRVGVASLSL